MKINAMDAVTKPSRYLSALWKILFVLTLLVTASCDDDERGSNAGPVNLDFKFESDAEGWAVGYADHPSGLSLSDSLDLYQMLYGHSTLPAEIQPAQKGIRIRGANRSDDLFMYLQKKVTGLRAKTRYSVTFEIELASNVPTNAVGIGGAPGEGVTVKAGAVAAAPALKKDDIGWYRLTLDKGNQSVGGADLVVLGNIGVKDDTRFYELITRTSPGPKTVTTDAQGNLWLVAGTDSGFEGLTDLYYARIRVQLVPGN